MDCDFMKNNLIIGISSLNSSPKKEGKYEKVIILKTLEFFIKNGFFVRKHLCLNVAWGRVLSEIDIVAIKNNEIIVVEVKSKKDKIKKANKQINKLKSFVDYAFISSDVMIDKNLLDEEIGILLVSGKVDVIREPKKLNKNITKNTLMKLRKKCLLMFFKNNKKINKINKNELIKIIFKKYSDYEIKNKVREMVFCHQICKVCPI